MLTLIGVLIIITIVALLLTGKVNPILAMSIIPLIGAFIAGFTPSEVSTFFESGITKVTKVAVMFLFAILFFSVLKELHVFDPLMALLHKDLKCKAPLIEPNLRRNLGKWST